MLKDQQAYLWTTMVAALVLFTAECKAGGQKTDPLAAGDYPLGLPASTAYQGDMQSSAPAVAPTPLPPVQQASAARQEYCPVAEAKLGSMGVPIPVAIGLQTVYVCCAGCVEELTENPEQYLGPGLSTSAPNELQIYAASSNTTGSSSSRTGNRGGSCCH